MMNEDPPPSYSPPSHSYDQKPAFQNTAVAPAQLTTYSQQVNVSTIPVQVALSNSFRDIPVRVTCQFCQADVVTSTYYETGTLTWISCFLFSFIMPLGCCLIPFCANAFKDVIHTCPNCNQMVGKYNRA